MPVGGTQLKNSDFRIIAATNRNLQDLVEKDLMRQDFFYRIHVIPIHLPPLRDRKEDIPLLVDHFLKKHDYRDKASPLSGTVLESLIKHDWPGNVRELENTLHRYFTLKRLDFLTPQPQGPVTDLAATANPPIRGDHKLNEAVQTYEKKYLKDLLDKHRWNKGKVADVLGIGRSTLYRKLKQFDL